MLKQLSSDFERNRARILREWMELLRFPSISADPAHGRDCVACARWLARHLRGIGFRSEILQTPCLPVVYAERKGDPALPVVLLYGHYDVQPPDPLDHWQTPPFDPTIRQGRVFARGAMDNKGQFFYALKAIEVLVRRKVRLPTIRVLLEGEEESRSLGITAGLPRWKSKVKADILVVTDCETVRTGAPTLIMGLRGILNLSVTLSGPVHDLHSGIHGGIAPNPAIEMARLLTTLHRADGRIAVAGFYAGLRSPGARERDLVNQIGFDPVAYERTTGVPPIAGELRFTPPERVGIRPTIEINGIHSGYGGPGSKTIIPSTALAKISARLVPDQDPSRCLQTIVRHLRRHKPRGLHLDIPEQSVSGAGLRLKVDSPEARLAQEVLKEVTHRKPVLLWEGASIPVVALLSQVSGAEPILAGFGHYTDCIHAPNESFAIDRFRTGYLYIATLLMRVGERP